MCVWFEGEGGIAMGNSKDDRLVIFDTHSTIFFYLDMYAA